MNPLDELSLTGLRATGFHGVLDHERRDGQPFLIDVTLFLETAAAAAEDDLAVTVDYGVLARQIVAAVESEPVNLIETVAERIAQLVLRHDIVRGVRVTVHKPEAPIEAEFADVSVTITRERPTSARPAGFSTDGAR